MLSKHTFQAGANVLLMFISFIFIKANNALLKELKYPWNGFKYFIYYKPENKYFLRERHD